MEEKELYDKLREVDWEDLDEVKKIYDELAKIHNRPTLDIGDSL